MKLHLVTVNTMREGPVTRSFPTAEARELWVRDWIMRDIEPEWIEDECPDGIDDLDSWDLHDLFGSDPYPILTEITT